MAQSQLASGQSTPTWEQTSGIFSQPFLQASKEDSVAPSPRGRQLRHREAEAQGRPKAQEEAGWLEGDEGAEGIECRRDRRLQTGTGTRKGAGPQLRHACYIPG